MATTTEMRQLKRLGSKLPCRTRPDVQEIISAARYLLGVQFSDEDQPIVGDLLGNWSSRAILLGLSLLIDTEDNPLEAFRSKASKALGFLSTTALSWSDPRLPSEWRAYQNGEPLRTGIPEFDALAVAEFEKIESARGAVLQ